eukprot:129781_1
MDCIDQLQSSHRRLCSLYNDLYDNQRVIVTHPFGSGRDLSIGSLLKFAPIAENFQSYADDYKKELIVFETLLNTVQQTVKQNIKSSGTTTYRQSNGAIDGDDHKSATLDSNTYRKNASNEYDAAQTAHARAYNTMNAMPQQQQQQHQPLFAQEEEEEEKVRQTERRKRKKRKRKSNETEAQEVVANRMTDDALFEMQMDDLIGFSVEDASAIHEEDKEYQIQRNEMQQRDEAKRATIELVGDVSCDVIVPRISYTDLLASKARVRAYTYSYRDTFDIFVGAEIYTSTMLRFSGCYGLKQDDECDQKFVRQIMVSQMKFDSEQIENIQIRDGRTWCIVYVRCSMKLIRDRIKRMEHKNKKITDQGNIYRLNEYQRRNRMQMQQNEQSKKLYILNFDVLNKNCHKALTSLFLKFGDLADDVQIGINSRNDPFAKVLYKDIEDAKRLWTYQNFNAHQEHKKITFGKRELTIQYAKY